MGARQGMLGKRSRLLVVVVAVALFAAACDVAEWEQGGRLRGSLCDPTDTAINDGHGDGHGSPYTEPKGPLSGEDCFLLSLHLNVAARIASDFPTKGVAEANGWHWLAPSIPGQGTHHVSEEFGVTSTFEWWRPTMLMFDGNDSDAPLTGMMWAVQSGELPPEGFVGDNDHWHNHHMLCYTPGPFIVGDGISDEECAALGGTNVDASDTWLVHVWLPVYDGWQATDIFNKVHPGI